QNCVPTRLPQPSACGLLATLEADKCRLLQAAAGDRSHCHNWKRLLPGTCFENRTVDVDIGLSEDGPVSLSLWDTTGLENYDRLMALIYPENPTLASSPREEMALGTASKNCPDAAIVLVGTNLSSENSAIDVIPGQFVYDDFSTKNLFNRNDVIEVETSLPRCQRPGVTFIRRERRWRWLLARRPTSSAQPVQCKASAMFLLEAARGSVSRNRADERAAPIAQQATAVLKRRRRWSWLTFKASADMARCVTGIDLVHGVPTLQYWPQRAAAAVAPMELETSNFVRTVDAAAVIAEVAEALAASLELRLVGHDVRCRLSDRLPPLASLLLMLLVELGVAAVAFNTGAVTSYAV
uniref:C2 domain-containing protein n=1 Tax=Macrostomum lignano TaxID=282301 RepID=A0A1I8FCK8_9PLAT